MDNYNNIKSKPFDEFAEFLESISPFGDTPWDKWFENTYCNNCEEVPCTFLCGRDGMECYCNENKGKCRFFDHYLLPVEVCELWLKQDVE